MRQVCSSYLDFRRGFPDSWLLFLTNGACLGVSSLPVMLLTGGIKSGPVSLSSVPECHAMINCVLEMGLELFSLSCELCEAMNAVLKD